MDDEPQKGGCPVGEVTDLVGRCRDEGLDVRGLMAVPALGRDPKTAFRTVRSLVDRLGLPVCSIGMSGDFETAIAEGSTMVRVGSALFGRRPPMGLPPE